MTDGYTGKNTFETGPRVIEIYRGTIQPVIPHPFLEEFTEVDILKRLITTQDVYGRLNRLDQWFFFAHVPIKFPITVSYLRHHWTIVNPGYNRMVGASLGKQKSLPIFLLTDAEWNDCFDGVRIETWEQSVDDTLEATDNILEKPQVRKWYDSLGIGEWDAQEIESMDKWFDRRTNYYWELELQNGYRLMLNSNGAKSKGIYKQKRREGIVSAIQKIFRLARKEMKL